MWPGYRLTTCSIQRSWLPAAIDNENMLSATANTVAAIVSPVRTGRRHRLRQAMRQTVLTAPPRPS